MKYLPLTILLLVAVTSVAYGHGSGQILEKQVGDFMIDVDYDSISPEIDSQAAVRFNFNLWNKDRSVPAEFTDLWVRIAPQGESGIVFAGNIYKPAFGAAGFSYEFSKGGPYELTVRFQKNGESLHEDVSFPITVLEGTTHGVSAGWRYSVMGIVIGIIIGFALAFFLKRRRMKITL